MAQRIFITGGAGYVGSLLVPSLLAKGYEVVVYDLYLYGDVFKDIGTPHLTEIRGDIRDKKKIIESAKGCDAMIHLACISNDPSFELNPTLGKSINYDAFYNVIDAVQANGIQRFIYASTSSVYGVKEEPDVREDATLEPLTDYSKFKAACEQVLKEKDPDSGWVIVRPATVCGYAPRLRLDLSVNILTINAIINKKIKIFGGNQLRPNINIKDMVRVYELLLSAPKDKIHRQTFNAGFQNLSIQKIAQLVKDTYGHPEVAFEVTPSNDNRSYHINSDKIKNTLGFAMKYDIEDAVRTLTDAYEKGLIVDGLQNPLYYNIKRMQEAKLT